MNRTVENWESFIADESKKAYFKKLMTFVEADYLTHTVYPKKEELFQAFNWTPYDKVKVVILGQDPYHGENQAHGLSFSVLPGAKVPPSLVNIYKELASDLAIPPANHGYLEKWAKEGVLLLNTVLTVRKGEPNSHQGRGWEEFTDTVIQKLNQREEPVIFILWGKPSQRKESLITNDYHYVLKAPHPSPLAAYRGFFGSQPFSKVNQYLTQIGSDPIDWQLDSEADNSAGL